MAKRRTRETDSATRKTARTARKSTAPPQSSFWERLSLRNQHFICIGVLLLTAIIFFAPYHLDGRTFIGHDVIQWRAGAQSINEARVQYGEEPLWATNMFSGMPMYVISHVRQPPNIDNVILPALQFMYPIAQYWILLGGAYFFFILIGFRPLSAVAGALIIGFTTYIPIIIGAGHNTKFWAYTYVPWIFSGYALVTRYPRWRMWGAVLLLFALVLHLRQSHPQVTYYYLYLLLAWWIFDLVRAVRAGRFSEHLRSTGIFAAVGIVALLAVIQPYWAIAEYSPYSIRGGSEIEATGGLDIDYAFVWSQGWGELLTLVAPNLYGGAEAYWGPKPMTSGPHYFGAVAFLLLLIGLFRGRHDLKWLFFGIGALAMLFALGRHFPALNETMFHILPGFNKFRTPEMWLIVTVFGFALVSLTGIEWLFDRIREAGGKQALSELWVPMGLVVGFSLILAVGSSGFLSFERPGEREQIARQIAAQAQAPPNDPRVIQAADQYVEETLKPARVEKASSDSVRLLIFVALAAGAILLGVLGKIPVALSVMAVVLLCAIDLLAVGARYIDERQFVPRGTDPAEVIESYRRPMDAYVQERVATDEGWEYRVLPLLDNPFNNAIPAYFYPSVGGYSGAKMGTYQDVIDRALFAGQFGLNRSVLNMLNVRFVMHTQPVNIPGFEVAFEGDGGVVIENIDVLPRAFFVDSLVAVGTPEEALAFISDEFDAAVVAVVEADAAPAAGPDAQAAVRVTTYRPRVIALETERTTDGFLVLSEIYYPPGWSAWINDTEVPIYKTNYILRGIEVPAGSHTVRLEFNPRSYTLGQPIAHAANILIWLALVLAIGLTFVRARREEVA